MTIEEKVGQLLMVNFHGEVANDDARTLIQETHVGGIIYYNWANGLTSPKQVSVLSAGLQDLVRESPIPIPLFIAADQEGGLVSRLNEGFTAFPGNRALGAAKNPDLVEDAAFAMGQEMRSVGINMNLAPVVDVNVNPRNPVIGIRSFGDDPQMVATCGRWALKGFKRAHVIGVLKHFPGHGDVELDSHVDLPVVRKTIEALQRVELFPFTQLVPAAEAVMTAHVLVPAIDDENCATLSKKTLTLLKDAMHFQGIVVADSLVMQGVLKTCQTVDEAAIRALNAGCDMLILGGRYLIGTSEKKELTVADVQRIHRALVHAVQIGRIAEERLNDAFQKILALKHRYLEGDVCAAVIHKAAHEGLAHRIATCALQEVRKEPLSDLHQKKIVVIAPKVLREVIARTSFLSLAKRIDPLFFGLNPTGAEREVAKQRVEEAEGFCLFAFNAWKDPSQRALVQELLDTGKPHVIVIVRDPIDGALFPSAGHMITTFSPTAPSIQAAWERVQP